MEKEILDIINTKNPTPYKNFLEIKKGRNALLHYLHYADLRSKPNYKLNNRQFYFLLQNSNLNLEFENQKIFFSNGFLHQTPLSLIFQKAKDLKINDKNITYILENTDSNIIKNKVIDGNYSYLMKALKNHADKFISLKEQHWNILIEKSDLLFEPLPLEHEMGGYNVLILALSLWSSQEIDDTLLSKFKQISLSLDDSFFEKNFFNSELNHVLEEQFNFSIKQQIKTIQSELILQKELPLENKKKKINI